MDTVVRIVCIGLLLIGASILFDGVKLLIESNGGKKPGNAFNILLNKPMVSVINLVKNPSFFFMFNHGPDLCAMEEKIVNIPYYKNKSCLLILGADHDKN